MYFRLQLSGVIAGVETFTVNPVFDVEGELAETWEQETANAMITAAAAVDIPTVLRQAASVRSQFGEMRLEGRTDADDSLLGVAVAAYSGEQPASSATAVQVAQAAIVLSLRTDAPGASGRGRLYWPAMGAQIGTNLRLTNPTAASMAEAAAAYLNDVRLAMEAAATSLPPWSSLALAVRSKTTHTTPHVVRVMVGDVIDTQRRRRDALPETYVTSAFPPA
jgi:hypothetical protein